MKTLISSAILLVSLGIAGVSDDVVNYLNNAPVTTGRKKAGEKRGQVVHSSLDIFTPATALSNNHI
jgi:hypothetical protein